MRSTEEIRSLLTQLGRSTAEDLEAEDLEFKSWEPEPRARIRSLREHVVCLANARGGTIVLGVRDKTRGQEAIEGAGAYDLNALRRGIYDGTDPHVLVDIEELGLGGRTLLLIQVPRGMPPHTTSEGLAKIRVGKDCQPLTGQMLVRLLASEGQRDLTAEPVAGLRFSDLDPDEMGRLRGVIGREAQRADLARLAPKPLLEALELTRGTGVSLAALLLVGRPEAIARHVPQHEVSFLRYPRATRYDQRHDFRGPLLKVLDDLEELVSLNNRIRTVQEEGFGQLELPELSWEVAREAILNALTHRDYFLRQGTRICLFRDRLEVESPGGFAGGITPANVLRHAPVHRNPLLARAFQAMGLVNRVGLGVDRMYEGLLRLGKEIPRYTADESSVRLTVRFTTDDRFARFVAGESRKGRPLELDDLLAMRALADSAAVDRWSAARALQTSEEEAARKLSDLRERGYLTVRGRGRAASYSLKHAVAVRLREAGAAATIGLQEERVRLRIMALLRERGRLSNEDIRRFSGFNRAQAYKLIKELEEAGDIRLVGRGRGAHIVPDTPGA